MKWMIILLILIWFLTLFGCKTTMADDTMLVHAAAHVGLSYAINDVAFTVMHDGLGMNKWWSLATANVVSLGVGLGYKVLEANTGGNYDSLPRAMTENAAGVIASSLTIVVFRFK